MGFRQRSESSPPTWKTFHICGSKCNGKRLFEASARRIIQFGGWVRFLQPLNLQSKDWSSYLNFYYNFERGVFLHSPIKGFKITKKINWYTYYYKTKMKTLTLHTICSQPSLRNEWTGLSMFTAISNRPAFNTNLGKVDYISTKLEEASGW